MILIISRNKKKRTIIVNLLVASLFYTSILVLSWSKKKNINLKIIINLLPNNVTRNIFIFIFFNTIWNVAITFNLSVLYIHYIYKKLHKLNSYQRSQTFTLVSSHRGGYTNSISVKDLTLQLMSSQINSFLTKDLFKRFFTIITIIIFHSK